MVSPEFVIAIAKDDKLWVFLRGELASRTDDQVQRIGDELEAIAGVAHVAWDLPK